MGDTVSLDQWSSGDPWPTERNQVFAVMGDFGMGKDMPRIRGRCTVNQSKSTLVQIGEAKKVQ